MAVEFLRRLCAPLVAIALFLVTFDSAHGQVNSSQTIANAPTSSVADERDGSTRLRVTWGGGEPSQWRGRIELDRGPLWALRVADLNADSAGSVWIEGGVVEIRALSARNVESIEISAADEPDSALSIELSPSTSAATLQARVSLADVLRGPVLLKLDERGNTVRVERAPSDMLAIVTTRTPLIFSPREEFSFTVQPALAEAVPGTTLDFEITLSPVGGKDALWRGEPRLEVPIESGPALDVQVPLPAMEGVYAIRIAVRRPPGFGKRFLPGAAATLAERTFQIVVMDPQTVAAAPTAEWKSVLEIDPANPRWWDRLPSWTQLRLIPGLNRGPLGSIRAGIINHRLGPFVELPPTASGGEPHWQAYSLPLEAIGEPHMLEIDFPVDQEQQLGISVIEPNKAGAVRGISRDAGVFVEGLGRTGQQPRSTHRVLFWPQTQAPLLMISNQHPTNPARFGHIRVLKCTAPKLPVGTAAASAADRWVAAYVSRPMLADSLGASNNESMTQQFNRPFESVGHDWHSHYVSASRLAEYLRYAGYNSAVITLETSAGRLTLPASGNIPLPSDVTTSDRLELLLRFFDRNQIALVPAIHLDTPLPELEEVRRISNPQVSGLEWVGPDGRTWLETYGSTDGRAPYYNLLDPRVQQAIIGNANDLVQRYSQHPSLAGVAVQLSSYGYAQLPPLEWGLDDTTISRFERDTGVQIDDAGANRFASRYAELVVGPEGVIGPHADAWRAWRAARLTEFYAELAATVRRGNTQRRLLLTTEDSLEHPSLAVRVRPNLLAVNRVHNTLLDVGIQPEWLQRAPGVVYCPTKFIGPAVPLRDRATDFEINEAFAEITIAAEPAEASAALHYHRPKRQPLASLAAKSPFRIASDAVLMRQPLAHGFAVRQPYVDTIAQGDFTVLLDGGALLPMGQEGMLRDVRLMLQRLPTKANVAQFERQPIVVRSYAEATGVTLLVINTCPWPAGATINLNTPQTTSMEPLAYPRQHGNQQMAVSVPEGIYPWKLRLEPYGVEAVRFSTSGVQVADVQAAIGDPAKEELASRILKLTNRDTNAPRIYRELRNPSFEPIGGNGSVPGWSLQGDSALATVQLDATAPQRGQSCAHLTNRGQLAVLESDPFPVPPTGQLAMTVFLRTQDPAAAGDVRIVVEADQPGRAYRRAVSAGGLSTATYPLTTDWRPYPLLVNDLPLESATPMRIKFEMTGPGEVWIDEVTVYDLLFPLPFYKFQQAESLRLVKLKQAALSSQEAGRITDCVRLLESYWPRFLVAYTPVVQPPTGAGSDQQIATSPAPTEPKQETRPGIGERIKWMLPMLR